MTLKFLLGAAMGYVLGARAGRARYESIVRMTKAAAGSQPVQTTAGVAQVQADELSKRLRHAIGRLLTHDDHTRVQSERA